MCEMVVKVYQPKGDLESMVSKVVKDINEEKYKHAEREKQRMDNALAFINESDLYKDKSTYDLKKMKQRKEAKNARKDTKNVKTAVVNQGEIEDYDIERVLQDLEVGEVPKKSKNSKKKEKKRQKKRLQIDDKPEEKSDQPSTNEVVGVDANDRSLEIQEPTHQRPINSAEGDCSICFCPKTRTFAFIPCFHATFCQDCSERIFNDTKRCPTCQVPVASRTRIFL